MIMIILTSVLLELQVDTSLVEVLVVDNLLLASSKAAATSITPVFLSMITCITYPVTMGGYAGV